MRHKHHSTFYYFKILSIVILIKAQLYIPKRLHAFRSCFFQHRLTLNRLTEWGSSVQILAIYSCTITRILAMSQLMQGNKFYCLTQAIFTDGPALPKYVEGILNLRSFSATCVLCWRSL